MRYALILAAILAPLLAAQANAPSPPSAVEMLALYEINRARSNPQAYDAEQGLGGILAGIQPAQPLALNERLVTSARFHCAEMAANGYFAHTSPITFDQPNLMARNAGYPLASFLSDASNGIESIAVQYTNSPGGISYAPGEAIRALILDTGINPPGHRWHLLAWGDTQGEIDYFRGFREVGVGYAEGFQPEFPYNGTTAPNGSGAYYGIHTGVRDADTTWICGVVYNDGNSNGRYDAGEGLGGVNVTTTGMAALSTVTNSAGGFSMQVLLTGSYTVNCSGGAFTGAAVQVVDMNAINNWIDFRSGRTDGTVNFDGIIGGPAGEKKKAASSGGGCAAQPAAPWIALAAPIVAARMRQRKPRHPARPQ